MRIYGITRTLAGGFDSTRHPLRGRPQFFLRRNRVWQVNFAAVDGEPAQGLEVGATATIPYVMDGMRGSAGGELNGACQKHREV